MKVVIALLFVALLAVQCASGLQLSLDVPTRDKDGSTNFKIGLTKDGLELTRRHESFSEGSELKEQEYNTSNETYTRDNSSAHLNQEKSNTKKVSNTHESNKKTQETGFTLNKGGLNLFHKKKGTESKTTNELESGNRSSLNRDNNATYGHEDESGSEYSKSSLTKENKEQYENKGFTLGGAGGFLTKTNERGTSETYDADKHEEGTDWKQSRDITKNGNQIESETSKQASQYAKDSKESSATSTHEKETKVYQREENNEDEQKQIEKREKLEKLKKRGKEILAKYFGK